MVRKAFKVRTIHKSKYWYILYFPLKALWLRIAKNYKWSSRRNINSRSYFINIQTFLWAISSFPLFLAQVFCSNSYWYVFLSPGFYWLIEFWIYQKYHSQYVEALWFSKLKWFFEAFETAAMVVHNLVNSALYQVFCIRKRPVYYESTGAAGAHVCAIWNS